MQPFPDFYPLPTEAVAAIFLDHLMMEALRQRDAARQSTPAMPVIGTAPIGGQARG